MGFSTGMLSLYCSIAKASVFAGWLPCVLVYGNSKISREFTRKNANFCNRVSFVSIRVAMRESEN